MGTRGLVDLRKEFQTRGWDRKATGRVVGELLFNLAIALGGIYIFVASSNPFLRACAMILSTAASMGVATNTHTSSHYATSEKRGVNEFLTFFGYPVFLGLSACYWWHQHVVLHHPAPNVVGVDDDVDLAPWFARTKDEVQRSRGFARFYYQKLQFFVFPFAIGFIGFNMQKAGWIRLIKTLRDNPNHGKRPWIDLGAMILHYVVWIGVPMIYFAPASVVAFYVLRTYLMGYALFAVLAPGHFPSEAVCLSKSGKDHDYLLLQTAATVNFRTGVIGKLMCSGLEYQIEHHLFPNISHNYYPKMADLVQDFCRESGLPYRCYAWDTVLWKCLLMFRSPSPVQVTVERLPSMVAADSPPSQGLTLTEKTE
jgi:linoleoyl-CoA desaturase